MAHQSAKTLLYIADPMCSWCWGFSPVIETIRTRYKDHVPLELMVGGLRPGNTELFDEPRRQYILGHWHAVHQRTGQPFNFACRMGSRFTYDTEPPSRAVIVVRTLKPESVFSYFDAIQRAFYVDNHDVTKEAVLTELAQAIGLDQETFEAAFQNPDVKQQTWQEFDQCRQLGISGFPSLVGMAESTPTVLARGYLPFEDLQPTIETWIHQGLSG